MMIIVIDEFLEKETFKWLENYCNQDFEIVNVGGKEFSTLPTPEELIPALEREGYEITLTFIRSAYKGFDDEMRIHADNIINGHRTAIASVLYINEVEEVTNNGTAFWKHHLHGTKLRPDVSEDVFNDMLQNDSNDITKWQQTDFISAVPNRILTYDANYFHSKFPAEITTGTRKVLVVFYRKI